MFELIMPGWLAGILLSLVTGPLGSFVVWRRMSSFGDTLSHSSLLGLAMSIAFDIDSFISVLLLISFFSIILSWLEKLSSVSMETILSITSHSSLSLGMVIISLISATKKVDINNYLFGDLLSVKKSDLMVIVIFILVILSVLIYYWNSILSATMNEELAQIDGINIYHTRFIIMLMTALTVSIAIKFVGSLLITSLLVIPPATAHHFSNSPEKMVIIAIIVSILSVTGGIFLSVFYHTPTSPSIVLFSSFFCILSYIKKYFSK